MSGLATTTRHRISSREDQIMTTRQGGQRLAFHLIFALSYLVYLLVAVAELLLPRSWRAFRAGEGRKSVFGTAREAASISTGFAFMG